MLGALEPFAVIMTVVGLGGLIFFHELGHFLACRVTGTRVEAFSIGFGPQLFGWRRGNTVYKLCIIPLGGYVKMAAENPGEENTGAPDEFPNKSFSARLLIMSAGVIFNAILAFLLFAWAFGLGVYSNSAQIGSTVTGGPAWEAGLQTGDIVRTIDGQRVFDFKDLFLGVALADADETLSFTVERGGKMVDLSVTPRFDELSGTQSIGVGAYIRPDAAGVVPDSPIAKAGGRKGDRIVAINGVAVDSVNEAQGALFRLAGTAPPATKSLSVALRILRQDGSEETLQCEVAISKSAQVGIVPYHGRKISKIKKGGGADGLAEPGDVLLTVNGEPMLDLHLLSDGATDEPLTAISVRRDGKDLTLTPKRAVSIREFSDGIAPRPWTGDSARVSPRADMPAAKAGLRVGDTVVTIAGTSIETWSDLQTSIRDHGRKPIKIQVKREDGKLETLEIQPAGRASAVELGYLFEPARELVKEESFTGAIGLGWSQTVRNMREVILTIRGLVTTRLSHKLVGGPIAIAQVTYGLFEEGWSKYLWVLAMISINLAILNLLPIPILDGGQILILVAEKIRGKPLPDSVIGYMQLVGLVLILGLFGLAFTNDITNLFR